MGLLVGIKARCDNNIKRERQPYWRENCKPRSCKWINVLNQWAASSRQKRFLHYVSVEEIGGCIYLLPEEWMGKFLSMSWFLSSELLQVVVMTALYSRVVYAFWFKQQVRKTLSYKYSRFSLLLASRGRKKFHTDDVKTVENLVRNSDWST